LHCNTKKNVNRCTYRCDRSVRLGGGVLVVVKADLVSQRLGVVNTLEFVAVRIQVHDYYVFVSCSYIPPRSDTSLYLKRLAQVQSIHLTVGNNDHLIVLGDFNLPAVSWIPSTNPNVLDPTTAHEFVHGLIDLSLGQLNSVLNWSGKVVDLIFPQSSHMHMLLELVLSQILKMRTILHLR